MLGNSVELLGRLVRDAEVRHGKDDNVIANFTLAVDRRGKKDADNNTDFINCVAFKKTAELIEKYTSKGTKLLVGGCIRTGSYTNKEGKKVYTTDVWVDEVAFVESKKSQETQKEEGFMEVPSDIDSELPFR